MELKKILAGINYPDRSQEQVITQDWSLPVAETVRPQILKEKFRRYFEAIPTTTIAASTTTTIYETFFDYPTRIKSIMFYCNTEAAGSAASDILKITVDDALILNSPISTFGTIKRASLVAAAHDISNNLAATATIASEIVYNQEGVVVPLEISSHPGFNATSGTAEWIYARLSMMLDTYCVRHLKIQYQNVQAAKTITSLGGFVVTDRPVESTYSIDAVSKLG